MKRLTIIYGDSTLFDGEVAEMVWADSANGVRVEGKVKAPTAGNGLMDLLAGVSKSKTAEMAQQKRASYVGENS